MTGEKQPLRLELLARRRHLADRQGLSRRIAQTIAESGPFAAARKILFYVDIHSEVETGRLIALAMHREKQVFVPYCLGDHLRIFRMLDYRELTPGAYGIMEPDPDLRHEPERHAGADQMDLILVPGVGFDRQGNRLGFGRGYYDRLLRPLREEPLSAETKKTHLIGLAFECQLVDHLPIDPHDVAMDAIVTERAVYGSLEM